MKPVHVLSLFGRFDGPFLVPVKKASAAERGRGQGRPSGRRVSRLALDADKPSRTLLVTEAIGKTPRALRASAALLAALSLFASGGLAAARPVQSTEAPAQQGSELALAVSEAASRFGLPEPWIYAVIRQESGGRTGALSAKGAMGLLQLMPATWRELTLELGLGDDPFDVRANVLAGSAYMRRLYDQFGSPGFLAAYNAGPQRYADFLTAGKALPLETRLYVRRVAPLLLGASHGPAPGTTGGPLASSLFVASGPMEARAVEAVGVAAARESLWP